MPELFNALKYMLVLLLTFPQALLVDSAAKHPHRHYSVVIGIIVSALVLFQSIASLFTDISLYRLLFLSSLPILLFNGAMGIIYFVKDLFYIRKEPKAFESTVILGIIMLLFLCAVVDISLYMKVQKHMTDWGSLMRSGYLLFIVTMLVFFLRASILRTHEARLAETYKTQARTDAMTGLLNKGAYLEKETALTAKFLHARQEHSHYSFVVMVIDLNNLKAVNDTLGHEMGDEYIKKMSSIFSETVGKDGEVYRIGGDEFLILIFGHNPEENYRHIEERLLQKIDEYNTNNNPAVPLSFAYGHALCTSSQSHSIHDSVRFADAEMYERKRHMHAER